MVVRSIKGLQRSFRVAIPGLAAIVFANQARSWVALLVGILVLVSPIVGGLIRYVKTTHRVDGDTFIQEGGLVSKWRRTLPRARIQSVDVVQKLWHQILGVVELRLEAVGGGGTEAVIDALKAEDAEVLKRWALTGGAGLEEADEVETPALVELTPKDLVIAGLTGGRVAVLFALIAYVFELLPENYIEDNADEVAQAAGEFAMLAVVVIALAVLILAFAFSIVATIIIYWGFTVRRSGDRLVVLRGLIDRRQATIPQHRIQKVVLVENVVRRLLGYASLKVTVAGYAGESHEVERASTLLPIARRPEAVRLASQVLGFPEGFLQHRLAPAPRRGVWKRIIFGALPGALAAAVLAVLFGPLGSLALVASVAGAGVGYLSWRHLGLEMIGPWAVVSGGALTKRTSVVPVGNIQHLKLRVTPLQGAQDLATLILPVPKGVVEAVDMERARVEGAFEELASVV